MLRPLLPPHARSEQITAPGVARDRCLHGERGLGTQGGEELGGGTASPQPGSLGPNIRVWDTHSSEAPTVAAESGIAASYPVPWGCWGRCPGIPLTGRPGCETLISNLPQPHSPPRPCANGPLAFSAPPSHPCGHLSSSPGCVGPGRAPALGWRRPGCQGPFIRTQSAGASHMARGRHGGRPCRHRPGWRFRH